MTEESRDNISPADEQKGEEAFLEKTAEARKAFGRFTLGVVGGTGVGKSSLVNAIFGRDVAETGVGMPVTQGVDFYHDESLGIWDFQGFEIGSKEAPGAYLARTLREIAAGDPRDHIDVVWYCVAADSGRLTEPDIEMITALQAAGLPVIIVLTKTRWTKTNVFSTPRPEANTEKFVAWLAAPVDKAGSHITIPFSDLVLTATQDANGKPTAEGLDELIEKTLRLAPETAKDAFRIAQRRDFQLKKELAKPVILQHAGLAAAAGATPLPIADSVALIPIQTGMMARIAVIYDLELTTMMSAGTLAQAAVGVAGRALAASALKLIPGAGLLINAAVAGGLTAASGEGWARLCERVARGDLSANDFSRMVENFAPSVTEIVKEILAQQASKPKG